jgi:hypothetical protein
VKDRVEHRRGRSSEIKQNAPNVLMLSWYLLLLKMLSFVTARCTCGQSHPGTLHDVCGFGMSERSGIPAAGGASPQNSGVRASAVPGRE